MGDSQTLLSRIKALRQRLEQVQLLSGAAEGPGETPQRALATPKTDKDASSRVKSCLEWQVSAGSQHGTLLDTSLKQLAVAAGWTAEPVIWPTHLTIRARRLLERGQELIAELRRLGDEIAWLVASGQGTEPATAQNVPLGDEFDPLGAGFRETAAMTDTALRMVQAFPDAPSAQLRLCEGLAAILEAIASRISGLFAAADRHRRDLGWVGRFSELLLSLEADISADIKSFLALTEELVAEAEHGMPLRFLAAVPREPGPQPARFIACHSLIVAQVMARVARQDPEWRSRQVEAVLAALLHDAGMLRVPKEILAVPGPLSDEQRRAIEGHTRAGAEMASRLAPSAAWLAEAAAGHHERLDGTGYPAGLRGAEIPPLNRLLAACDVYAALCGRRSHRPALETRTALTETLLLAEEGKLAPASAERLLVLSFYPVGSVVELADGAVALVVATNQSRHDWNDPARPVVALLIDPQGAFVPDEPCVNLADTTGRSIVRSLPLAERRRLLGQRYPQLAY